MTETSPPIEDRDTARRNTRARFEQWAQNPACEANTVSAVHNIKMADVAEAEGYEPTMGQSPFAIARGDSFERGLFYSDAERMLEALKEAAVLPPDATGFVDLRTRMNGGPQPSLDAAIDETRSVIRRIASGTQRPSVIAGATVRIPRGIMLPEAVLILDVLAIRNDRPPPS